MHELSIAEALLDIVLEHAGGRRVERVEVRAGRLRQVVPDALAFSFELVARGTAAEGAELVMEEVPVEGRCRSCGATTRPSAFPLGCAACGGLDLDIVGGEELCVDAIEVAGAEPVLEEAR